MSYNGRIHFFNSLRSKLLLGIVTVLVLSIGVSIYGLVTYQRKAYYEETFKEIKQVNEIIETALKYEMMPNKGDLVDKLISEVGISGEYKKIILVNKQGEVRHASEPDIIGKKMVREKEQMCMICHQDSITPEAPTVLTTDHEGETVMRSVNLIENEPMCYGCHDESKKILGLLATDKPIGSVEAILGTVQTRLIITGLATLAVIFIGISIFTNKFIHRPVGKLMAGARRVSEGDYDFSINVPGRDELASLARSFNNMVGRIKDNITEIKKKNAELNTLYRIVEQISQTMDFDKLKLLILNIFNEVLSAEKIVILTFGTDREKVEITVKDKDGVTTAWGEDAEEDKLSPQLRDKMMGKIHDIDFIQPEVSPDACTIYIPLIAREVSLGILMVQRPENAPFNESEQQLVIAIAHHISVALENARLYTLATTDELTKAYTLRYFQLRLEEEIGRFNRYGQRLAVLMADLDKFKLVNDTFGHPIGDEVLKRFCQLVLDKIRDVDVLCRYGGEEFAVILPSTTPQGAYITAERIRKSLDESPILIDDSEVKVTVSIGIATCPDNAQTPKNIVLFADKALYRAKALGRNRVCIYTNGEE
jgi:diguanylate cyclase (GGDEF)-like protein